MPAVAAAILAGLLLARYATHYFFLYDDFGLFNVAESSSLAQILTTPLIGFYRPLPFVLLKAEMAAFGWDAPGGLAACLLLLHLANAILCGVLTRQVTKAETLRTGAPLIAMALFLISPWATEGFLWASGVFDVVATFGMLLAVLGARRATEAGMPRGAVLTGVVMAAAGALIGLFSKESGVMIPALVVIAIVIDRPFGRVKTPATLAAIGVTLLPLVAYAIARSAVIGLTKGAYGDISVLWQPRQVGNLLTYLRAIVWVPMRPPWPPYATVHEGLLRQAFAFVVLPCVAWQLVRHHARVLAGCVIAACLAALPVMWFGLQPDTTVGGRFAYGPAVWVVIALAIGIASLGQWLASLASLVERVKASPWRAIAAAIPSVLVFAYFGASFVYQLELWALAGRVSRSVIGQVERYRGRSGIALDIQNLPSTAQEGPYILKAYAFRCYRAGHVPAMPPVKARMQVVKLAWQGQAVFSPGVDPSSDYLADPPSGLTTESVRLALTP